MAHSRRNVLSGFALQKIQSNCIMRKIFEKAEIALYKTGNSPF